MTTEEVKDLQTEYFKNRKKNPRPQALLLANNPGYIHKGSRIPDGTEFEDFIILSDDNRAAISIAPQRIEKRERTVNGRMRSYHIADKLVISTSWNLLPSRAFDTEPAFSRVITNAGNITNLVTSVELEDVTRPVKSSGSPYFKDQQYTSDAGAGGAELLDWYNKNQGSFWVYLGYDNYKNLEDDTQSFIDGSEIIKNKYQKLNTYAEVVEVFFGSFDYSIESRGANTFDLWNISLSLEEV
jgi:hypothetical protein